MDTTQSERTNPGAPPDAGQRPSRGWVVWAGGAVTVASFAGLMLKAPPGSDVSPYPACPFKALTGWDCPFCGGLRATHELLVGNIGGALDQNILVPFLYAAILGLLATIAWRRWREQPPLDLNRWLPRAVAVGLALFAVFAVIRNLPGVVYLPSGIG